MSHCPFPKLGRNRFFIKAYVDPEMHTVCWPGELDLAPDALHEKDLRRAETEAQGRLNSP